MNDTLRDKYEDVDLTPGKGKISATVSLGLGMLALMAALCFLFPALLTTPELRPLYAVHAETLRWVLFAAIAVAFGCGFYSTFKHEHPGYGVTGMALACIAALLGSGVLDAPDVAGRSLYAGFDYFVLTLLILGAVFIPLERLFPKNPGQKTLRKGWITDMKYFLFSHVGVQLISFFTIIPVQVFLTQHLDLDFQKAVASQPLWLQFIEILLVVDITTYWIHRALHEVPWLWKFHAVHHSSEQMDWLASSRLHVVELLATRLAGYLPIFIFGFAPSALYAYLVFVSFHAIFIHANVRFRFPVLRWIIATPEFHHWHHSSEQPAIDKNYAAFLPLYDVIFRTTYLPDHLPSRYGTVGKYVPAGFTGQFAFPFSGLLKKKGKTESPAE